MPQTKQRSILAWATSLALVDEVPMIAITTLSLLMYNQFGISSGEIIFTTAFLYIPRIFIPLWRVLLSNVRQYAKYLLIIELLCLLLFIGIAMMVSTRYWYGGTFTIFCIISILLSIHFTLSEKLLVNAIDINNRASIMGTQSLIRRIAIIIGQGILVMFVGNIQVLYRYSITFSWSLTYYIVAGLFVVALLWHSYILPYQYNYVDNEDHNTDNNNVSVLAFIYIFIFIASIILPEALTVKTFWFYLIDSSERGGLALSPQEFALVQGTIGAIGLTIGGLFGGNMIWKWSFKRSLYPMLISMVLANVIYYFIVCSQEKNLIWLSFLIFFRQVMYGFCFTSVLYLISRLRGYSNRDKIFAVFIRAVMPLTLFLGSLYSGYMVEEVGYKTHFLCNIFITIPSLLLGLIYKRTNVFSGNDTL